DVSSGIRDDTRNDTGGGLRNDTRGATRYDTPSGTRNNTLSDTRTATRGAAAGTGSQVDEPLTDAMLEQATQTLARRLGPIARMMVKRASAQAATRGAFCIALVKLAGDATDGESLMAELQKLPVRR
ncbi:MAG TPA: hypothetical protein PK359_19135, partial [Burkholderiaceae bacterium]|nr:hypothetical protein [Burkholderiaceae bacterium]